MVTISQILDAWNNFFFATESAETIALLRIFTGILLLYTAASYYRDIKYFLGPEGIFSYDLFKASFSKQNFSLFNYLPPTMGSVYFVYGAFCISSFCLMIGFLTLLSNIIVFATISSLHKRNTICLNGGDTYLRIVSFFMIFMPTGYLYSVDSLIFEMSSEPQSVWALRLLQIIVAMVYFSNVFWKIRGNLWLNGTASFFAVNGDFRRFKIPKFLFKRPFFHFLTYSTLVVELSIPFLIWIEEFLYFAVFAGIFLHIGIELMMNIQLLSYVSMVGLFSFVKPEHSRKMIDLVMSIF